MTRRILVLGSLVLACTYLAALAGVGLLARPERSDLLVVLGNELTTEGLPSLRLQARLDAALAAFRAGLAPRVLVSGGVEPGGGDEAAAMAEYLAGHGVPREAIVQDPRGVDTMETARAVAGLLDRDGRVLVVTQWFHIPRTWLALRRFGFRHVSAVWPRYAEVRDLYSFGREAVAVPAYAVRSLEHR